MMADTANNRGQPAATGVIFTLGALVAILLLAALVLLAGSAPAADDVGSPTAPISRGEKKPLPLTRPSLFSTPLSAPDGKFLESLRFWERVKLPPQSKPPVQAPPQPDRPREVPDAKAPTPSGSAASGTAASGRIPSNLSSGTGVAPEPPPNPYAGQRTGIGDAPLPAGYARTPEQGGASLPSGNALMSSYSSYSFDTRDWVEFFPGRHEPMPAPPHEPEQEPAQLWLPGGEETPPTTQLPATQPTSLRLSTTLRKYQPNEGPNEGLNVWNPNEEETQWDGLATSLVMPHHSSPAATAEADLNEELPPVDVSPSYSRRLPYVQTCGVVVVQANFPLTEMASILEEIEQLQYDLYCYMGVPAPKEKIELCLFRNESTYLNFLQEYFPRAPRDRRALYVKPENKPGTLMVQKTKDFELDLRHEMTHAIIHASIARVPIWLDEGLAKYFEVPSPDRAGNHPYMAQVRWAVKFGSVPSLDRLAKLETIEDMGIKEYRDSWAWTHFLIHRSPETHQLLASYLQMLATRTGEETVPEEYAGFVLPGGRRVFAFATGRDKQAPIPSLKPQLDGIMKNQREMFREHFTANSSLQGK